MYFYQSIYNIKVSFFSLQDLIVGTVLSIVLFLSFIRYIEDYDIYQQTHRFAPIMITMTALLLCTVFYPSNSKISSKGDAVQIVSAMAGVSLGSWMLYQYDYMQQPQDLKPYAIATPTLGWLAMSLVRFLFGLVVLGISYLTLKKITVQGFSNLYGLDHPDKSNPSVLTAYKFTTYFTLGFLISYSVPVMYTWFGIERASFFSEVL